MSGRRIFFVTASLLGILCLLITALLPNQLAEAAVGSDFRAGNIINDGIFFNSSAMNPSQIQAFLNAKVPACDTNGSQIYSGNTTRAQYGASRGYPAPYTCLRDYVVSTPNKIAESGLCGAYSGGVKSSAQIIYDVGQACGINPQVLIVLLQKEQSLVTDAWPWPNQYQIATGFGCPDTAPCDAEYYGFFNQVYNAARIYRKYARDAGQFNYLAGRNNNILYNPVGSCGSSAVFLQNQATAGLYNYTPYQPNTAALNNLYGTGDSCSAYGNRNFWRMFYDWFGSTNGGVSLIRATSSPTVYVLYGGKKQGIPSGDVLSAWGLQSLPITVTDDASADIIPTLPPLTRLAKNPYTNGLYLFADNGGTFDTLGNMASNWGYDPAGASTIGSELVAFTSRRGGLSAFITAQNAGAIYMVDGGIKRAFSTPDNFYSWANGANVNVISSDLFSLLTSGSGVLSNQAQTASSQYITSSGRLLSLGSASALYPRNSVLTISDSLASVLPGGQASRFITGDSGTIYLVDNGMKHGIASLGLLNSYAPPNSISVTHLSTYELGQIPNGQVITTRFAYNLSDPSKQFYINSSTYALPVVFSNQAWGFGISQAGLALVGPTNVPISCTQGLVQAAGSPGISIMDNGVRRGIASLDMLSMIKNDSGNVCILNPEDVNVIPAGTPISPYVSNSGVNYIIEQNSRYTVSPSVSASLGSPSFTPVSNQFIANYSGSSPLDTKLKAGDNLTLVEGGRYFSTTNQSVASLWNVSPSAQAHTPYILKFIPRGGTLIPFAKPTDPTVGAIYIVDNGKFLPIASLDHLFNAGFGMQQIPAVSLSYINANLGTTWQGYLAKNPANNQTYVLEGGKKHLIPSGMLSTWLGSSTPITPTDLSATYLGLLTDGAPMTKSIETNAPGIYGIIDGKKAGIPNLQTFNNLYAPSVLVSGQLINSIPWGSQIPAN